jgi:tetratricopeptide (TPR) repeat protein
MKTQLYLLFAFTLSLATVGLSANLIAAEAPVQPSISQQQMSDDEAEALKIANAYLEQGNIDKAILALTAIVEQGSNSVAIYTQLGDLYIKNNGQASLAEESYTKAVQLAKTNQDLKSVALLQIKLARTKLMLGKNDTADQLLNNSQVLYTSLGETNASAKLAEWRRALQNSTASDNSNSSPIITRGASDDLIKKATTSNADDYCVIAGYRVC